MNEELKQIAIKAKELGFKARTVTTIHTEKYLLGGKNTMLNDMCFYLYLCDLQEWLRSNKNIEVIISRDSFLSYYVVHGMIQFEVGNTKLNSTNFTNTFYHQTYNLALQEGIKESLKLINT